MPRYLMIIKADELRGLMNVETKRLLFPQSVIRGNWVISNFPNLIRK